MTKRLIDLSASALALLLLSPVLLVLAVVVWFTLGWPVLFRQVRPGREERPFTIYKFRTMKDVFDSSRTLLPDGERLHPFGSFLRSASLDELPELWNVLRGDMSLVGPRPLLTKYLPYFFNEERLRFTVRPGITGWAQINGRNEATWNDRLARDVWYVQNQTLSLDIRILLMTLARVITREQVIVDARSIMLNLDEERAGLESKHAAG
jgi:lipopolysaccharide/colanic/teichoic acid biosynthesis glycosyltransferase